MRDLLEHFDCIAFITAFEEVLGPLKQGRDGVLPLGYYFVKRMISKKDLGWGRRRFSHFRARTGGRLLNRDLNAGEAKRSANVLDDPFSSGLVDYLSRVRRVPSFDRRRVNGQRTWIHEEF